jgi:hypothetical protein
MIKICVALSLILALFAAGFWFWSALVNIPSLRSGFGSLVTVMPDGSNVVGVGPFFAAMKKIARLNAAAAGCAFFSAVAQALVIFLQKR